MTSVVMSDLKLLTLHDIITSVFGTLEDLTSMKRSMERMELYLMALTFLTYSLVVFGFVAIGIAQLKRLCLTKKRRKRSGPAPHQQLTITSPLLNQSGLQDNLKRPSKHSSFEDHKCSECPTTCAAGIPNMPEEVV